MLPNMQQEEFLTLQQLTKDMSESEQQQFIAFYRGKRKDSQELLVMCIIGFFGVAGIHRFIVGDTAMGIVYLLTAGFCGIGTIIDLINIKKIATEFNLKQAYETAGMVRALQAPRSF